MRKMEKEREADVEEEARWRERKERKGERGGI